MYIYTSSTQYHQISHSLPSCSPSSLFLLDLHSKKISFEYIIRPLDNFIKLDMLKKQSEKFCKMDVSMAYLLKTRIQFSFEKYSRIG